MTDLVEFLLARIAEDEEAVDDWHDRACATAASSPGPFPCDCHVPKRMMAECAAKRAIVERFQDIDAEAQRRGVLDASKVEGDDLAILATAAAFQLVVNTFAQPYADHPDFPARSRP